MPAEKIQLKKEKETLLATLYARALESSSPDSILRDEMAEEAIRCIDYDFERLKVDQLSIAMRAKQFDLWTENFLKDHRESIVLNLGCGLDSRIYRINPPDSVLWFDVDFPEVIDLRRRLFPERTGYVMVGSSLADRQWLANLPHYRPAWIMLEGVSMYLTKEIMEPLLKEVTDQFPSGGIALDAISPAAVRMAKGNRSIRETGATFGGFSINAPEELKMIAPKLELVEDARTPSLPGYAKLPLMMRALVRVFDTIPSLRKMSRILRYRF